MKTRNKILSFMLAMVMVAATFVTAPFTAFAQSITTLEAGGAMVPPTLDGTKDKSYGEIYNITEGLVSGQSAQLAYAWDANYIYVWASIYDSANKNGSGCGIDHTNPAPHLYLYFDFGDGTRTSVTPGANEPSYYTVGISKACAKNGTVRAAANCTETENGIGAASDNKLYFIQDKSLTDADANIGNFELYTKDNSDGRTYMEIAIPHDGTAFQSGDVLHVDAQYVQIIGDGNVRHDATLSGYDTEEKGQSDDFKTNPSTLGCTLTLTGEAGDGTLPLTAPYAEDGITLDGTVDSSYGEEYVINGAADQWVKVRYAYTEENIYVWAQIKDDKDRDGDSRCLDPDSSTANVSPHAYLYFDFDNGEALNAEGRGSYLMMGLPRAGLKYFVKYEDSDRETMSKAFECKEENSGHGTPLNTDSDGKNYFCFTDAANEIFVDGCYLWTKYEGSTRGKNTTTIELSIPNNGRISKSGGSIKADVQFATYDDAAGSNRTDYTLSGYSITNGGQNDDFKTKPDTLGCTLNFAGPYVSPYETTGGHDKTINTYYIKTAEQFKECITWLDDKGDAEELVDQIILLNDIDMSGITDFKPAAGWKGGTFDGQGHVIKNLTSHANWTKSNSAYNSDHCGLFMDIKSNTTIKDVAFINMVFNANNTYDGGMLVGMLSNNDTTVTFENVVVSGKTEGKPNGGKLGYFASCAGKKTASTNGQVNINNCVFVLTDPEQKDIFTLGWVKTNMSIGYGTAEIKNSYALNVHNTVVEHDQTVLNNGGDNWTGERGRFDFLVGDETVNLVLTDAYKLENEEAAATLTKTNLGESFTFNGGLPMPVVFVSNAAVCALAGNAGLLGNCMIYGASIRLAEPTGIRFTAELDLNAIAEKFGEIDEYGIIVTKVSVLGDGEFTQKGLSQYARVSSTDTLDTYSKDGKTGFSLVLTGVPEKEYATVFCARAYVKVGDMVYYTTYTEDANARSIRDVAQAVQNDDTVSKTDEQRNLLSSYIGGGSGN